MPLKRGLHYHDIRYDTAITVAESESDIRVITDTPYYCEDLGENWPRYNGSVLYEQTMTSWPGNVFRKLTLYQEKPWSSVVCPHSWPVKRTFELSSGVFSTHEITNSIWTEIHDNTRRWKCGSRSAEMLWLLIVWSVCHTCDGVVVCLPWVRITPVTALHFLTSCSASFLPIPIRYTLSESPCTALTQAICLASGI